MTCDLYGASNLEGQPGLCRANPGTAYGPRDGRPGAVMTQAGVIVPDPTRPANDQPWSAFHGESLRSCDARQGYYEIADSGPNGATFNHTSADVVRTFPNMSQDRASFSAHAGRPGTLCLRADQPAVREGIIRHIRGNRPWYVNYSPARWFVGECPTGLSDQQCEALATSMEHLRPPQQDHLTEFFFLIAAFTIGPDVYHALKRWIQSRRNGGNGDGNGGSGGGGGNIEMTPEQLGRALAAMHAAPGQADAAPQAEGAGEAAPAGEETPASEAPVATFTAVSGVTARVAGVEMALPAEMAHLADVSYTPEGFAQAAAPIFAQLAMRNGIGRELGWNQAQWTRVFQSALTSGINNAAASTAAPAGTTRTADTLFDGMMQLGGVSSVAATVPGRVRAANPAAIPTPAPTAVPAPVVVPRVAPVVTPRVAPVVVPRMAPVPVPL